MLTSGFPRTPEDPTARFILDLALALSDNGYTIIVLAPYSEGALREENWGGLKIYRFPYFYPGKLMGLAYGNGVWENLKNNILLVFQVPFFVLMEIIYGIRISKKEKISVVHANWLFPQAVASIFIRFFSPTKIIVTVHGSDIRVPPKWLSKIVLKRMDAIISPHPEITHLLESLDNFQVREIHNVIDESKFNLNLPQAGLTEELEIKTTHIITFVSRLNTFKDPITFVKCIPFVVEQEPDVTFIIAGDGPLMEEIRDLVEVLHIQKYIRVLGNRMDVNRILKASTVFVALSPYENIWSLVIIEAMKMGVPCIITNSGTTARYLQSDIDAILIPPMDERILSQKILQLIRDEKMRKFFSENGKRLTEGNFSTKSIVNKYNQVISGLFESE